MCAENQIDPTTYTFTVNNETIVTIYDVPHLLKCTQNALLKCKIIFENNKIAKFEHIKIAFEIDQTRPFKQLHKLTVNNFNFKDSFIKMRMKIAARQLSTTVAAAINSMTACGIMPSAALNTAIFAQLIDDLFDSLNGHTQHNDDNKTCKTVLKDDSPHMTFWSKLIPEINAWKLIDLNNKKDVTNSYPFVKSWVITLWDIIYLWKQLQKLDFHYLILRNLNQDPLENLFCNIRQHGVQNSNPTCHQFTVALKTVVLNKLAAPVSKIV